jgi:transcriptional regulator with XRE-family HTH domain
LWISTALDLGKHLMEKHELGLALHALRTQKQIGLRRLARMAEISPASLIAMEKGTTSPTLATLNKVLKALGSTFRDFFSNQMVDSRTPIFPALSMSTVTDAHREYTLVFPKRADMRFEMILENIAPCEQEVEWEIHDCDLGGVILSGEKAALEIEAVGRWELSKGDGYYVPAGKKHRLTNGGKKPLKQITVFAPPRY